MRTTLSLDSDVAQLLKRLIDERGISMKELVNTALRHGLQALEAERKPERFETETVSLEPVVSNLDNVAEVLAEAEGEEFSA